VPQLRRLVEGFPTRRPGFEPGSGHVGFVVEKNCTGAGFLQVLRFSLPILIPPTAPHSSSIIRGWCNRSVAEVLSGLSHNSLQETKKVRRRILVVNVYCCTYGDIL
jgi:hypothetical protein